MDLPAAQRTWYRNPDGSCVQCSIGMVGLWQDVPPAYTLLWDTEHGPAERGGAGPSRVASYAARRGIKLWQITGQPTLDWARWAARTGRYAALGLAARHFQTLVGYDPWSDTWYVCDNRTPSKIDMYNTARLRQLHEASGRWIVILDYDPVPPLPR